MIYAHLAMSLSQSAKPSADPFSDVLAALGVRSVRGTSLEASGDWALAFDGRARLKFVGVTRGRCWLLVPAHPPEVLTQGDVVLLSNTSYTVASDPSVEPVDGMSLYEPPDRDTVRLGTGLETVLIGGGSAFADGRASFVFEALPTFLPDRPGVANRRGGRADAGVSAGRGRRRAGGGLARRGTPGGNPRCRGDPRLSRKRCIGAHKLDRRAGGSPDRCGSPPDARRCRPALDRRDARCRGRHVALGLYPAIFGARRPPAARLSYALAHGARTAQVERRRRRGAGCRRGGVHLAKRLRSCFQADFRSHTPIGPTPAPASCRRRMPTASPTSGFR